MKKIDDKSLKINLYSIGQVMKITYEIKKSYLLLLIIDSILKAIKPFIPIVFAARILDELLGQKDIDKLILYVSLLVGLMLITHMLSILVDKKNSVDRDEMLSLFELKMSQKSMEIDYEYIEDTKIHELRQLIYESNNVKGGLWGLTSSLQNCLLAVFEIIIATIVIISTFANSIDVVVPKNYEFIQSPLIFLGLVVLVIMFTSIYAIMRNKIGAVNSKAIEFFMPINRIFGYLLFRLCFNYENGKDIRLYNANNFIMKKVNDFYEKSTKAMKDNFIKKNVKYFGIISIVNLALLMIIYIFVILKAYIGAITIGTVMLQINAILRFYQAISSFIGEYNTLKVGSGFFAHSVTFLNLPPIKYVGTLPVVKRNDNKYDVEFCNVSFKYPSTDIYVLKNVSFKLNIGERLAVVGMNGAGKTTMIKLLCRLYDPTEGEIRLNGIDIKKYRYDEYLSLFSVVFQDFKLFAFPMDQNIATSIDIDKKRLDKSIKDAGLSELLTKLDGKTNTAMGKNFDEDGVDFSGGEKQKIAIARALYKDASIIVLDEPTAALDPIAEFDIYSRFDSLVGNKTAIYISHRLSSCRFCHDIMVFDEGEIIQRGSHEELIQDEDGKYHEMWNAQAQYYKDDEETA